MKLSGLHILGLAALLAAGCAIPLGRSALHTVGMALRAEDAPADVVAAQIRAAGAELVLLSSTQDTAWFADVAAQTGLLLSGPGRTGARSLAFLTRMEALGDTTIVLTAPDGGRIHMHDALYRINGTRFVNLMYVRFDEPLDLGGGLRTLLEYIATDVAATVPLLLAVEATTPALADSVAARLRVLYPTALDCLEPGARGAVEDLHVRLFYGPPVRIRCRSAQQLPGVGTPVAAHFVIER